MNSIAPPFVVRRPSRCRHGCDHRRQDDARPYGQNLNSALPGMRTSSTRQDGSPAPRRRIPAPRRRIANPVRRRKADPPELSRTERPPRRYRRSGFGIVMLTLHLHLRWRARDRQGERQGRAVEIAFLGLVTKAAIGLDDRAVDRSLLDAVLLGRPEGIKQPPPASAPRKPMPESQTASVTLDPSWRRTRSSRSVPAGRSAITRRR